MGMRDYAVNDYGLILDEHMMKIIASQYCKEYTEKDYDEDPWSFHDEMYADGIVDYIGDFSGETIYINDDGSDDWVHANVYNSVCLYFIPTSKIGTLFCAAYKNMDEITEEFKTKVGKYFTEDFNYRECIRHIIGTYFG